MSNRIQLKDKKIFLKWFLQRYQMKRRESMWILNYLINHDIVLNKTKFVEQANKTPRGIQMVTVGSKDQSFEFYKDGLVFDNPEQAFHDIRLNWHHTLYVELVFKDSWRSGEYLSILEDNPYAKWNDTISNELNQEVDHALDHFLLKERKQKILEEIDLALEDDEKESFFELANELKEIDEELENGLPHS